MPRSRYQQQDAARKRWQGANPGKAGRPRPVAYEVVFTPPRPPPPSTDNIFRVEGTDVNSLQRPYQRAKRRADNVNGYVKSLYKQ